MKIRDARDSRKAGQGAEQVDHLGVRDVRKEAAWHGRERGVGGPDHPPWTSYS